MAVLRNRLIKNFTIIPNAIITAKISANAFRIYCYLASKPEGWKVLNADIKLQLNIKDNNALAKYWKELIDTGWIIRRKAINDSKQFIGGFEYQLNESPLMSTEDNTHITENHTNGKSQKTLIRTDLLSKTKEQEQINIAPCGKAQRCTVLKKKFDFTDFTEQEIASIHNWFQYKKERKQSYKTSSYDILRKKLLEFKANKYNLVDIIETSISNNWSGLFAHALSRTQKQQTQAQHIAELLHNCNANFVASGEEKGW